MHTETRMGNPRTVGNDVWLTPQFVIEALGGWQSFDLDPCAPPEQPWPTARRRYTEEDNGLVQPWEGRVWMNPPYSQTLLKAFMQKLADHGYGTALIFAKTETRIFFETVWDRATALLFVRSRLHFYDVEGNMAPHNSGAPTVLVAYGPRDADILGDQPIDGKFVPLRVPRNWVVDLRDRSWRELLESMFGNREEPVALEEIYRAFAADPKTRSNRNWKPKLRQTLQRAKWVNVGPGVWSKN